MNEQTAVETQAGNGDLGLLLHAVGGFAALLTALALGWGHNPALFIINVSVSMISIVFLTMFSEQTVKDADGSTQKVEVRALTGLSDVAGARLVRVGTGVCIGLFVAAVAMGCLWSTTHDDPFTEGTTLSLLIAAVWSVFMLGAVRQHVRDNAAERSQGHGNKQESRVIDHLQPEENPA